MYTDILINHAIVIQKKMNQAKYTNQNVVNNLVKSEIFLWFLLDM